MTTRQCRLAVLLAWAIMLPPMIQGRHCRVTYREDRPIAQWHAVGQSYPTQEECERVRLDLAHRQARDRPARIRHARDMAHEQLKWRPVAGRKDDPSSDLCQALADDWSHTRCFMTLH